MIRSHGVFLNLKPPKITRKVVSTLSDEEIGDILSTFSTSPTDSRNQTLFMLLLDTGLRIGELINRSDRRCPSAYTRAEESLHARRYLDSMLLAYLRNFYLSFC